MQLGSELALTRFGCNLVSGGPATSPGGTGGLLFCVIVLVPCYRVSCYMRAPGMLPTGVKLFMVLLQTAEQFMETLSPPLAVSIRRFLVPDRVTSAMLCICVRMPLVVSLASLSG